MPKQPTPSPAEQRRVIGVLSHADAEELEKHYAGLTNVPTWQFVRKPETGLVMVRGRIAAEGAPFNFGETTVTRAVVTLETGETGFSYALGRDHKKAEISAIIHALWKNAARRSVIEDKVLKPLAEAAKAEDDKTRGEVAPTKVDFFTLVRGDD